MPPLFTRFVLSLQGKPDEELALAAWERLREILEHELKRRGLWSSPPTYLGIYGRPGWSGPMGDPDAGAALDELVAEAYAFIFVDRLGRLQAQLEIKPNIEGLVLLNVRHFFLERQKEHDPLGYRVFEMLHAAVKGALENRELHVLAGDPEVRNDTLLGFAAQTGAGSIASAPALSARVGGWNDLLLPELVLARGRRQEEVWAKLRALLAGLESQGVAAFRFRDVLDPLKNDTRRRWASLLEEGGNRASGAEGRGTAQVAASESPVESRQTLEQLTRYIAAALQGSSLDSRTRDYLVALWRYLRVSAGIVDGNFHGSLPGLDRDEESDNLSHRRLAQLLEIPRDRLPSLFAILRRWVFEAAASARTGRSESPPQQPDARRSPTPRRMDRPLPGPRLLRLLKPEERRDAS
jgi:hypothetical protein